MQLHLILTLFVVVKLSFRRNDILILLEYQHVRDLYGTVLNEGATKGILGYYSDYGHDAHEFAKGKPITLLNGSNLLHLLEKHGHKAKIDLKAARQELADKEKQSKSED